eukprot:TRINITY_DN1563_c0_g1_i1.p1 TRINITY_DN1563_c0_g1~~TRINITY_DN1563_c0_g1_i1.p1  ORF type:complete len:989 (-),score=293.81 TRINITY_DN1563_c0_g1_i1:110-3076(-)
MYQWRYRFQFFDKELVKEADAPSNTPHPALQKLEITCTASGRGQLLLGDAEGYINVVDRDFTVTSFQAYERRVSFMQQLKQRNLLISVGEEDEDAIKPLIKIWNFDRLSEGGHPALVRSIRLHKQASGIPVTALVCLEDMTHVAIGLANGAVLLLTGDVVRDRHPRQHLIRAPVAGGQVVPVTGLGFNVYKREVTLFIVTTNQTYSHRTNTNELILLDDKGADGNCTCMSDEQDIVLARPEAFYFYTSDDRGPCFAFEGDKKFLSWFRSYLVVVGRQENKPQYDTFTIYDLKNKFIAYSGALPDVRHVASEWGSIFVITKEGKVFEMAEKDTQTKLELLFKKNLYSVAINLANSQRYDYNSIVDIFRRYGDHLYSKGDYDTAINQYVRTIGRLEPSYIIRKFLDAQRIHNLTTYLQALHERGLANADHTTLLLNCYTKLKDVKKLDQFIKSDSSELNFDVQTAIKVCRQAGYHEHAMYLARKHDEHHLFLNILVDDLREFEIALGYIETLDFFEAEKNLKQYGKTLVEALPQATTSLLKRLCTNYIPKKAKPFVTDAEGDVKEQLRNALRVDEKFTDRPVSAADAGAGKGVQAPPEEFIHIYVKHPDWLMSFLEFIVSANRGSAPIYNTLLELYIRGDDQVVHGRKTNVSDVSDGAVSDVSAVGPEVISAEERENRAYDLLTNKNADFDNDHVLVLCQKHAFTRGVMVLLERLELYEEILRYHMEKGDFASVLAACRAHGDKEPSLWVQALSYFSTVDEPKRAPGSAAPSSTTTTEEMIAEVLKTIDRDNLLPPLQVLQILKQKPTVKLGVVRDYITRRLEEECQTIEEDRHEVEAYKEETENMRAEMEELSTGARIFQLSRCSICSTQLDLPAVHFLCRHSFHQRCLFDDSKECPICAPNNKRILEIKHSQEENADKHTQFFRELEVSPDGFSVVSEYFGRGVFNQIKLIGDPDDDGRLGVKPISGTRGAAGPNSVERDRQALINNR